MKRLVQVTGVALVNMIAFTTTGCGSESAQRSSASDRRAVEQAALGFEREALAGNWDTAREYVAKSDQDVMTNLAAGADPAIRTKTTGTKIGDITIKGEHATAVLLGKTCLLKSGVEAQCINNTNPSSKDPTFIVSLVRQGNDWKVVFPKPSGSYTETEETFP